MMRQDIYASTLSAARAARNLLINLYDPPVIVLLYHRVATLKSDPEMLAVSLTNFREQLLHVKECLLVVRFEEDWTKISCPAVAITFDDGYADNALDALPILEELGIPATFFISTGTIGTASEFWWDELERIILGGAGLPSSFTLSDNRFGREWPTVSEVDRREFYNGLVRLMNDTAKERRDDWLAQLRSWAQGQEVVANIHRTMTLDELRLLARSSVATIGAHTVSHTRLSALNLQDQREEITTSKAQLEAWLDREITVFSFPFGRKCDYTEETLALCREAGFIKAAANFPGQAHKWTNPYQIPRHLVRNWPVDLFSQKLKRFWRS